MVAVGATQALLSKHLAQVAAIYTAIGRQFVERAELQILCHTEHQRLIALFMNDQHKAGEAVNAAQRGLNVEIPQGESLVIPYLTEHQAAALRIQLAAAPPFQQGSIMREQVKKDRL